MIRSAKEDISCIPQLEMHDEILSFTTEEADAYNALISVIKRNLLLADFFDENHKESLLHPANRKSARTALQNLRLCCCVTGHIHFEVIRDELSELLSFLRETLVLESRATLAGPKVLDNELRAVKSETEFGPALSNGDPANLSDAGTDHSLPLGRSKSESLTRSKRCRYASNSREAERCHGSFVVLNAAIRDDSEKISESRLSFENEFQSSPLSLDSPVVVSIEKFQGTSPYREEDSTTNFKGITPHDGADSSSSHLVSTTNFHEALSTTPCTADRYHALRLPEELECRLGYVEQVLCNRAHALQSSCECCGRLGTQMPIVTPCAHILCLDCAASNRRSCSICGRNYKLGRHNEPVDLIELQPSFTQDSWVPRWDRKMTSKIARMLKLLEEWSADLVAMEPETFCGWGHNSEAETNRPAKRRHKVIVYSNFAHHFDVIHYHLSSQNFVFAYYCSRLSPAERRLQIDRFVHDPETWILLMDEKGALGLELSFVTRIIIMEPVWSRSQEHQIISRAHRIGARNSITVYRLMMRDSIETDLVDVNAAGVPKAEACSEESGAQVSLEKNPEGSLRNAPASNSPDRLGGSNKEQEDKLRRNRLLRRLHFVRGEPFSPGTVVSSSVRIL
ncbi:hypothetical protein F1559_003868 [Cyanidiococcus yangmingshanensis]|uniref:Helicase C-terminal domain-containing protein n=1 Tax=Cyanidiococcus yangmingshanensis TaxID=2690220 RepID=A0A7J7IJ02_9RHOD|nr:hypothetical protein F1559_003868 [Cyanidiococcus yangmingshanensis]